MRVDLAAGTATGEGTDTLVLEGRIDLVGTDHADVLLGSNLDDSFLSLGGDDLVDGRGGGDSLTDQVLSGPDDQAQHDADVFVGGPGGDHLDPGAGDDVVRGGGGRDQVEDDLGVPDILAGAGSDQIDAAIVLDETEQRISGGSGSDHLLLGVDRARGSARATRGGSTWRPEPCAPGSPAARLARS